MENLFDEVILENNKPTKKEEYTKKLLAYTSELSRNLSESYESLIKYIGEHPSSDFVSIGKREGGVFKPKYSNRHKVYFLWYGGLYTDGENVYSNKKIANYSDFYDVIFGTSYTNTFYKISKDQALKIMVDKYVVYDDADNPGEPYTIEDVLLALSDNSNSYRLSSLISYGSTWYNCIDEFIKVSPRDRLKTEFAKKMSH